MTEEDRRIKALQLDFKRQSNHLFFSKIPDTPNKKTVQRVFDNFGCYQGIPLACEFKWWGKLNKCWQLNLVKPHQVDNLLKFDRSGGVSLVAVFVEHKLFVINIRDFITIDVSARFDKENIFTEINKTNGMFNFEQFEQLIKK